jgi:hypothetical protein
MDFDSYQKEALRTDRVPARAGSDDVLSLIVPMLGLAGETGQLLSEYKKHLPTVKRIASSRNACPKSSAISSGTWPMSRASST